MTDRRRLLAGMVASTLLPRAAGGKVLRDRSDGETVLYANVGTTLTRYEVDAEACTLAPVDSVTLPEAVQYAWPHRSRRFLYAITSNTAPGNGAAAGTAHHLVALAVDPPTGALSLHGSPVALPSRPIHVSTDGSSTHALVAFNKPSELRVYHINPDGTVGVELAQPAAVDAGIYAHQVRVSSDDRMAVLVTRGNEGTAARAEEPGALKTFHYRSGKLSHERSIAPDQGRGFGPRHLDFHPTRPWVFVSIETQNQIALFRLQEETLEGDPSFRITTLPPSGGGPARQAAGPIHIHPNGRFVYVANRAEQTEDLDGRAVFKGGVNGIAVFAIDGSSGEPQPIQHIDSRGIHPRTFHIDPTGRMMVVEHNLPVLTRAGDTVRLTPAGLSVFRIADDGTLAFVHKYDVPVGTASMFWMGMMALPGGNG